MWRGAAAVAALLLPVYLVTANLRLVVATPPLYQYGFSAYRIPSVTGISLDQLLSAAEQTQTYFDSDEEPLRVEVVKDGQPFALYNQREVRHMADVKGLFRRARYVEDFSLTYLLGLLAVGLWRRKMTFVPVALEVVFRGSLLTLALGLLAGLGALVSFDQLFLRFHFLSFANTLWMLDPTRDYLIMMYPGGFFRDATLAIGALVLAEAGALLALSKVALAKMAVR